MGSIIATFLGIQSQFRVLHWQTQSYAKHVAYGGIYEALDPLIDTFLETYMGKYGRIAVEGEDDSIILANIGELDTEAFLETITDFLLSFNNQLNPQRDTDLLNLRDEMIAEVNKLKYLLTLK
jgi:hypothetical protein